VGHSQYRAIPNRQKETNYSKKQEYYNIQWNFIQTSATLEFSDYKPSKASNEQCTDRYILKPKIFL